MKIDVGVKVVSGLVFEGASKDWIQELVPDENKVARAKTLRTLTQSQSPEMRSNNDFDRVRLRLRTMKETQMKYN